MSNLGKQRPHQRLVGGLVAAAVICVAAGCSSSPQPRTDANHAADSHLFSAQALGPAATSDKPDLRVDANRDGTVDRSGDANNHDVVGKTEAGLQAGALFLPNLDDDGQRCVAGPGPAIDADNEAAMPTEDEVKRVMTAAMSCNDAADEVVNGADDAADLAAIAMLPMPSLSDQAIVTASISPANAPVRLFVANAATHTVLPANGAVSPDLVRRGLTLAIEATDIIRPQGWNGKVKVTVAVHAGSTRSTDSVALQAAPMVMGHNLQSVDTLWLTQAPVDPKHFVDKADYQHARDFALAIDKATADAATKVDHLRTDQFEYVQDAAEPMTVSMPGRSGIQSIRINLIRPGFGATALINDWRGKDMAVLPSPVVDGPHGQLNAGGNTEVIPPYTSPDGTRWPHGRLLMGNVNMGGATVNPSSALVDLYQAQGVQGPALYANTRWLLVGHIDEVVSFIPASTPRGWKLVIADPRAALKVVEQLRDARVDVIGPEPRNAPTTAEVFTEYSMRHISMSIAEVDTIEAALRAETGLTDSEIVRIPVSFTTPYQSAAEAIPNDRIDGLANTTALGATFPNAVNAQLVNEGVILVAGQFGPQVNGVDPMQVAVTKAWQAAGLKPVSIDDRFIAWAGSGDVHCSTSAWRTPTRWWELARN